MAIEEIIALLEPPKRPAEVGSVDWPAVEEKYKIQVPPDFKEFAELYGTGCIGEFLWVFNPFSENQFLNFEASKAFHKTYSDLKLEFPELLSYPEHPANGSLFPFATTDNGDMFCWIVDNESSEPSCTILSSDPAYESSTKMSFASFMVGILRGELGSSILPEDFLTDKKRFAPQRA